MRTGRGEPVRLRRTSAISGGETQLTFDEVWGATICPDCFTCRGELEVRGLVRASDDCALYKPKEWRRFHQRCGCEGSDEDPWGLWPRTGAHFDFNCYLELCRCCCVEPIRSGSRWSLFFCEECKARVFALNRALGRWVVPIGRHSAMHGILVRGDEAVDPQVAERFVGAARGLFRGDRPTRQVGRERRPGEPGRLPLRGRRRGRALQLSGGDERSQQGTRLPAPLRALRVA